MTMRPDGFSPITEADGWMVGDDFPIQWEITDRDPATQTDPPAPKDISGFTLEFKVSPTKGATATLTKAVTIDSALNGLCSVTILDTETDALNAGTYYYTLRRTDANNERTLAWGTAVLQKWAA